MRKPNKNHEIINNVIDSLVLILIQPFIELFAAVKAKRLPIYECIMFSTFIQLSLLLKIDYKIFNMFSLLSVYPINSFIYKLTFICLPFYLWGVFQVILKRRLIKNLTEVFLNSGLKSFTGKLPSFVFDKAIDKYARKLRVLRNGKSLSQFESAKDSIESGLQVYIDEVKENRESGTIDIIYSHSQLTDMFEVDSFRDLAKDSFLIGKGRSKNLYANLSMTPHLLIAGQTGMGKSTFLRQFITSLYLKNKKYTFDLIDLKEGLEFQIFENLERVTVQSKVETSIGVLKRLAQQTISQRSELLKVNSCKDIEALKKIPVGDRKGVNNTNGNIDIDRHLVIIDEAFDLFMAGPYADAKTVQQSRKYASKIAAQGRAVGIHIVIATQRPDRFAIDPQTKANLTGKVCFRVPNIASSMTVMDSKRAVELPNIKGRAIWQDSSSSSEIQSPFFSEDKAISLLQKFYCSEAKKPKKENCIQIDIKEDDQLIE